MILTHIVAAARNGVIGKEGQLPWNIPEDLKFFREKTRGHILIMGRKTFESLPGALPKRLIIVVTRDPSYKAEGALVVPTIGEAVALAREHLPEYGQEVFIAGGGEIYRQTLGQVDRVYLTLIDKDFDGDAFYPVQEMGDFRLVHKEERKDPMPYAFLTYEKP